MKWVLSDHKRRTDLETKKTWNGNRPTSDKLRRRPMAGSDEKGAPEDSWSTKRCNAGN